MAIFQVFSDFARICRFAAKMEADFARGTLPTPEQLAAFQREGQGRRAVSRPEPALSGAIA